MNSLPLSLSSTIRRPLLSSWGLFSWSLPLAVSGDYGRLCSNPKGSSTCVRKSLSKFLATLTAQQPSNWTVIHVPCLNDNYAYLLLNRDSKSAAVVDPSESAPVSKALKRAGATLKHILCTHHHWDHTGGNLDLKAQFGATVIGPAADKERIEGIDYALGDGDSLEFEGLRLSAIDTPGHTRGHCAFYAPDIGVVFTGDTLFSLGCGRLFEGTPEQSNSRFALSLEPGNSALQARNAEIGDLRANNLPTVPTTVEQELRTNPFLRPHSPEIRRAMGLGEAASPVDVFAAVRRAKDKF